MSSTTPHLTSTVYKRALDFCDEVPVLAVCTQRFHAALPPLLCCTAKYMSLTDFLVFNSPTCRNSITMSFVFAIDLALEWGSETLRDLIKALQRGPLPMLRYLRVCTDHVAERDVISFLTALPRTLYVLNINDCSEWYPRLSAAAVRLLNEFPLRELKLNGFRAAPRAFLPPTASSSSSSGGRQRDREIAEQQQRPPRWFPYLEKLWVSSWANVPDAFAVAGVLPKLHTLRMGGTFRAPRPNLGDVVFPQSSSLRRIGNIESCDLSSIDFSNIAEQLEEFGDEIFHECKLRPSPPQQQQQPQHFCGLSRDGVLDLSAFVNLRLLDNSFCAESKGIKVLHMPPNIERIHSSFAAESEIERVEGSGWASLRFLDTTKFFSGCEELRNADFLADISPGTFWASSGHSGTKDELLEGWPKHNHIGHLFFRGCHRIQRVDLIALDGVTEIECGFFSGCSALNEIKNFAALHKVTRVAEYFLSYTSLNFDESSDEYSLDAPLHVALRSVECFGRKAFFEGVTEPVDLQQLPELVCVFGSTDHLLLSHDVGEVTDAEDSDYDEGDAEEGAERDDSLPMFFDEDEEEDEDSDSS